MTDEETLFNKALEFATKKHAGQYRIGGEPYITHPKTVCEYVKSWGYGINYQLAALFHDLLEDTDATEEEIKSIGGDEVLAAVKLLTKTKGYVMAEYVGAIRKNEIAFIVKGADRLHNLRTALCTDESFKRRYILESLDWYLDFNDEIPTAIKEVVKSLEKPLRELPLEYKPIDEWLLNNKNNK